jgi:hypothetical protein
MGLLKLLTFPVSGPVMGGRWVLQTLLDEAERRYYDMDDIRQQLAALERQFIEGEIDERTFERTEEALLQRLMEAREFHRSRSSKAS